MNDIKEICDSLKKYHQVKNKKLEEVCHLLKKFKKQKEKMRLRGFNDFNYIDLLKGAYDENTHSKIIAEFLNPDGSHYQGKIFLENFFKTLDIAFKIDKWNVITERFVRNCIDKGQGRIDIYMTNGKKHIILENKIGAGDQEAQIFKYVECLYKENDGNLKPEDILVLYLTKNKSIPSKYSLDNYEIKNGYLENNGEIKAKIKCISYDGILKWMQENLKEVENITNLSEAIKQYIKAVKKILGKEENIMNLKDYLLKEENREVLITLIENKNEFDKYVKNDEECKKIIEEENLDKVLEIILFELRKQIANEIYNHIKKNFQEYQVINNEFKEGVKYGRIMIYKKNWIDDKKNPLLMFGLEWEKWGYRDLYYGIAKYDENIPYKNEEIPKLLKEIINNDNTFKTSKWWLTWKFFNFPYHLDRYDFWHNEKAKDLYIEILTSNLDDFVKKHYIDPLKEYINKTKKIIEKYLNTINPPQ